LRALRVVRIPSLLVPKLVQNGLYSLFAHLRLIWTRAKKSFVERLVQLALLDLWMAMT
jgi:hypothetical protein